MTTTVRPMPREKEQARPESGTDQKSEFERTWEIPSGLWGKLTTVQNEPVGKRIVLAAFALFLIGGLLALLMRIQLARPDNTFLAPDTYNQFFSMHGSTMMYLVVIPFLEGVATLVLPQMLGARELPFPRLTAFTFWTFLFGSLVFYASFLFGAVPDTGWTGYVPLSGPVYSPGRAIDFWLLGLNIAEVGAIAGAMELIIGVFKMRAPGMSLNRLPIFGWAMLVMGFMMLFGFTPLIVGSTLVELDRKLGTQFFNAAAGGDPVLWQHLFWIFGHPEVYIEFVPAMGIVAMIVPVFARRRLASYGLVAMAMVATGFLTFGLWLHHMFTVGLPQVGMIFFAAASLIIAIPSGIQIFSFIATFWRGKLVWKTPLLFVIGFIVIFVFGGITGVMVGVVPFNWQVHDTYFIVAHFHYVLIGGSIFPIFAAIYHWFPLVTGRLLNETLGRWNFWLMFVGFNVAFFPMHISGLLGMPRRYYTYPAELGLGPFNLLSTIGAFILAAGVAVLLWNVFWSYRHGEKSSDNPWGADSLEWLRGPSAPPYAFKELPIIRSRHPLWDQETLHEGDDERTERLAHALGEWPTRWRASLVTSTFDAEPEEVFRVAGPSIWPLVAATGVAIVFIALIFDLYFLAGAGALLFVVSLIGWHWPTEAQQHPEWERIEAFEREHGVPVHVAGSRAVFRWTMALTITALAVVVASFLFSYFYLLLGDAQWPPAGVPLPTLLWPGVASALLLLSVAPMRWAVRGIAEGNRSRLKVGLAGTFLLGGAAVAVQLYEYRQLPFSVQDHAYGSLFYTLGGVAILFVGGALLMSAVVQFWAWRGQYSAGRHLAVINLSWFWTFAVVAWLLLVGTLYGVPYLL